jgi:hypothetical protein
MHGVYESYSCNLLFLLLLSCDYQTVLEFINISIIEYNIVGFKHVFNCEVLIEVQKYLFN